MIQVRWHGRLGNNLFQYALGRILAEELGYELRSPSIPGFGRTGDKVPGMCIKEMHILNGQHLDLDFIYKNKGKRGFTLNGWFQRYEYYRPYKDRIREWYCNNNPGHSEKDGIVLHIRRTQSIDHRVSYQVNGKEIKGSPDLLKFEWYKNILDSLSYSKLYICTDIPSDKYLRYFESYKPALYHKSAVEDFQFMMGFNRIIMSISTYSWWSAFLSDAVEIYMPKPNYGCWRNIHDVNLIVGDEKRYHIIETDRKGTFF